jgi:hypothetical protein
MPGFDAIEPYLNHDAYDTVGAPDDNPLARASTRPFASQSTNLEARLLTEIGKFTGNKPKI